MTGNARARPRKNTLVRRLALAKLRELKRQGMSYREIGLRFGTPRRADVRTTERHRPRLPPSRLLTTRCRPDRATAGGNGDDTLLFLRALDALDQGLAFFDERRELLNANRPLAELLEVEPEGARLRQELQVFADALWRLTRLRGLTGEEAVEELVVQEVPQDSAPILLKGSYIGLDLFGCGPTVLIALDCPPDDPLSPESLQARFGLTPQECRIARHLASGSANDDIAAEVTLSPHTIRRHTEHILRKIGARSRTEAVYRILRDEDG